MGDNRRILVADLNIIDMPNKSKLLIPHHLIGDTRTVRIDLKPDGLDVQAETLVIKQSCMHNVIQCIQKVDI